MEPYQKPPEYRSYYPLGCICSGPTTRDDCPVHGEETG